MSFVFNNRKYKKTFAALSFFLAAVNILTLIPGGITFAEAPGTLATTTSALLPDDPGESVRTILLPGGQNDTTTEQDKCSADGGVWELNTGTCVKKDDWKKEIGTGLDSAAAKCNNASNAIGKTIGDMGRSLGVGKKLGGFISISGGNKRFSASFNARVGGRVGSRVDTAIGNTTDKFGNAVGDMVGRATGAVSDATSRILAPVTDTIRGAEKAAEQKLKDIGDSIEDSISNALSDPAEQAIKRYQQDLYDGIGSAIGSDLGSIGGSVVGISNPIPVDSSAIRKDITKTNDQLATMYKKQVCDDAVAYAVAHNLVLPQAVAQATNYLNTGNGGMPYYARNMGDFYTRVSNNQALALVDQINSSNSPVAKSVVPDVISGVRASQNPDGNYSNFKQNITPDLYKTAGSQAKADNFMNGDSSACVGYLHCLSEAANPNNNPYGVYGSIMSEYGQRLAAANGTARDEMLAGQGMLPAKKCVDERINEETGDKYCMKEVTVTPAITNAAIAATIAGTPLREAGNVTMSGQTPAPVITSSLSTELFATGFSGLSEGMAANANKGAHEAAKGAIGTLISSIANTSYYSALLLRGVGAAKKIVSDLKDTKACYDGASGKTTAPSGGDVVSGSVIFPSDEKIKHLDEYQGLADEYEKQLTAINVNPNIKMTDEAIANLALQVEQLEQEMDIDAANLDNCQKGVFDADPTTVSYIALLDRGISIANKIIDNFGSIDICYVDLNRLLLGNGKDAVEKPAVQGLADISDYQNFATQYTAQRTAAKKDIKKDTPIDLVDGLSLEVTTLNNELEVSDKALRACTNQWKAAQSANTVLGI